MTSSLIDADKKLEEIRERNDADQERGVSFRAAHHDRAYLLHLIATLRAENESMRTELETIADFAVGNGDVCEIIAKRARAASLALGKDSVSKENK